MRTSRQTRLQTGGRHRRGGGGAVASKIRVPGGRRAIKRVAGPRPAALLRAGVLTSGEGPRYFVGMVLFVERAFL
jgi:hypothetical protein